MDADTTADVTAVAVGSVNIDMVVLNMCQFLLPQQGCRQRHD